MWKFFKYCEMPTNIQHQDNKGDFVGTHTINKKDEFCHP